MRGRPASDPWINRRRRVYDVSDDGMRYVLSPDAAIAEQSA